MTRRHANQLPPALFARHRGRHTPLAVAIRRARGDQPAKRPERARKCEGQCPCHPNQTPTETPRNAA